MTVSPAAGNVHGSVGAVDGNIAWNPAAFEDGHAIFAARDDEGLEIQVAQGALAQIFELTNICADARVVGGFDFGFVGSGGGDSGIAIFQQAVTGIESEELGVEFLDYCRRSGAEAVVGD